MLYPILDLKILSKLVGWQNKIFFKTHLDFKWNSNTQRAPTTKFSSKKDETHGFEPLWETSRTTLVHEEEWKWAI